MRDDPAGLLATALALDVDRSTAAVVEALRADGVDPILLKGPALAAWLYADGAPRPYVDADLLVPPERFGEVAAALGRLGFVEDGAEEEKQPRGHHAPHAVPFVRASDRAQVDLHRTLSGAAVAPSTAWAVADDLTEPAQVGGVEIRVPALPLRALIVAFHASQHGAEVAKPLADLSRALTLADEDTWRKAVEVAQRLDALASLSMGLRLVPEGNELADRLGLPSAELARAAAAGESGAGIVLGLDRLRHTRGAREKLRLVGREAFPAPDFMRWWTPLARRGRRGLAAAYAARLGWLARSALPSLLLLRRARRQAALVERERATLEGPLPAAPKLRLALEVVTAFPAARLGARSNDVRRALRRVRGSSEPRPAADPASIEHARRLGRAVARTMRWLPGDTRCLTQSLVLSRMLARRGMHSTLVIGVRSVGEFGAHAWVEVGGAPVLPPRAEDFHRLIEL